MNSPDSKDRSSFHVIGKSFLIAMVIVFSSLGFVLGYFVGKSGHEEVSAGAGQFIEMVPSKSEIVQVPAGEHRDFPGEVTGAGQEPQESGRTASPFADGDAPMSATRISDDSAAAEPVADNAAPVHPQVARPDGPKLSATGGKETKARKSELVYTVQLGAFKNETEADNFRTIYDKKGYKPYITVSRNRNNERIYRIRSGEFRERKSAEILAMKLKKTEGLNSYVTFKNE